MIFSIRMGVMLTMLPLAAMAIEPGVGMCGNVKLLQAHVRISQVVLQACC